MAEPGLGLALHGFKSLYSEQRLEPGEQSVNGAAAAGTCCFRSSPAPRVGGGPSPEGGSDELLSAPEPTGNDTLNVWGGVWTEEGSHRSQVREKRGQPSPGRPS